MNYQKMNAALDAQEKQKASADCAPALGSVIRCPFCGCNAPHHALRIGFPVSVWCPACGATGPERLTGQEADEAWNTRTSPMRPPPTSELTESVVAHSVE